MSAIDKRPVFLLSSIFENGEKIKWTLYDERSDNFPFEKKIVIKYHLKSFLGFKKSIFCEAPGDDTDFASRFPKHEFLVVRHRAYRRNFRFLG